MTPEVHKRSLSDQMIDAILDLLASTGLENGAELPPARELATRFGVSVPVVREAIVSLSALGVLRRQQGKGCVVSTPDSGHVGRVLSLRVATAHTTDESVQLFREVIEVGSARLAARSRTTEALKLLDRAMERLRDAVTDAELFDADVAFHAAVAQAGENDLLTITLDAIAPLLVRERERVWQGWVARGGSRDAIIDAHAAILECIRAKDETGSVEAMERHLAQARSGL